MTRWAAYYYIYIKKSFKANKKYLWFSILIIYLIHLPLAELAKSKFWTLLSTDKCVFYSLKLKVFIITVLLHVSNIQYPTTHFCDITEANILNKRTPPNPGFVKDRETNEGKGMCV